MIPELAGTTHAGLDLRLNYDMQRALEFEYGVRAAMREVPLDVPPDAIWRFDR
jgi:hypothetical protein